MSTIIDTFEYKLLLLREIYKELNNRKKYIYYSYEPASDIHKAFHLSPLHIKGLEGSNRAGKTWALVQEVLLIMAHEHPVIKINEPVKVWWVGKKFTKMKEAGGVFEIFKSFIPPNLFRFIEKERVNDYAIECVNGSRLTFKSQEEGVPGFREASVHVIVSDERIDNEDIRNQLFARIIDKSGYIFFTFDALEDDLWAVEMMERGYAHFWHVTARDNKFLNREGLELIEKVLDDVAIAQIIEGRRISKYVRECFPESLFTEKNYQPIKAGYFDIDLRTGEFIENEKGKLRLFKEFEEIDGKLVIGIDTSEGKGLDYSVISAFDENGEQIFVWMDNFTNQYEFFKICELINIKLTNMNIPTIWIPEYKGQVGGYIVGKMIESENIYFDIYTERVLKYRQKIEAKDFGIRTEINSKEKFVNELIELLRENRIIIHDKLTYKQMRNYYVYYPDSERRRKDINRYGSKGRGNDDIVSTLLFVAHVLKDSNYIIQRRPSIYGVNGDKDKKSRGHAVYVWNRSFDKTSPVWAGSDYVRSHFR